MYYIYAFIYVFVCLFCWRNYYNDYLHNLNISAYIIMTI